MKKKWLVSIGVLSMTLLSAADYSSMSCYDLWYARNSIFADKGYCFQSGKALSVFGRRCYPPYGRLSRWEKDEVSRIKYWEGVKGCNGNSGYSSSGYSRSGGYAKVSGIRYDDTLAVRSGPSTGYMRIGDLPPDATGIEILECVNRWCRIRYGNLVGWAYSKYLRSY